MMMSADARLPRYQRLRDELAARIAAQGWQPGDAIPSEAELAVQHGLSVGTVRKAIDQLVGEGLLERHQGRGTFVRKVQIGSAMLRFFRFQSGAVPQARILHRRVMPAPPAAAAVLGLPPGAPVISLSRLRLVAEEPLLAEEIWLDRARFATLLEIDPAQFPDLLYPLYESLCRQRVASADEVLTVAAATPMQARQLRRPPGAPLIVVERTAFDPERRPLEWRCSRGPADRFCYRAEIR